MTPTYSKYIPTNEQPVITALLTALLAAGKTLTINDGEDDIVTSNNLTAIISELGGTGQDYIKFGGGFFRLIYNNGSEDDPMIVITDCSGNEFCEKILDDLTNKYGEW